MYVVFEGGKVILVGTKKQEASLCLPPSWLEGFEGMLASVQVDPLDGTSTTRSLTHQ